MSETQIAFNGAFLRYPHCGMGNYTRNILGALCALDSLSGAQVLVPEDVQSDDLIPGWVSVRQGHFTTYREQLRFNQRTVLEFLRCVKPRIFHSLYASLPAVGSPCRTIVTVGDMIPRRIWQYGSFFQIARSQAVVVQNLFIPLFARLLNERGIRKADAILTFSECSKHDIVKYLRVEPDRVSVIPIGVDPQLHSMSPRAVRPVLEQYGITTPYILYIGGFGPHKNVPRLIEAYCRLSARNKRSVKLVIAGSAPRRLAKLIIRLGLAHQVLLIGGIERDHRVALYNGAELLVYPSLYEGFGLPPLEAMSCGCAVVTSNTSSLPEVVGDAALTVNPEDPVAIADAMELVLNDKRMAADLRKRGLGRAQHFTWNRCVAETCRIYERILSAGGRSLR